MIQLFNLLPALRRHHPSLRRGRDEARLWLISSRASQFPARLSVPPPSLLRSIPQKSVTLRPDFSLHLSPPMRPELRRWPRFPHPAFATRPARRQWLGLLHPALAS